MDKEDQETIKMAVQMFYDDKDKSNTNVKANPEV